MKSSSLLLVLPSMAAAFTTTSSRTGSSSALNLINIVDKDAYSDDIGAMAPFGYWNPSGLGDGDSEKLTQLREVELRHGRCSMLAITGWLVTAAGVRLPGMEDMPFGFKALTELDGVPREVRGTLLLTLATGWFFSFLMQDVTGKGEFPGDYRNGVVDFGWDKQTDEWKLNKRTIELANGRAAMMGILGIMVHEQLGNLSAIGLPQP